MCRCFFHPGHIYAQVSLPTPVIGELRYKYYNVFAIYLQNQSYHDIQDIEICYIR